MEYKTEDECVQIAREWGWTVRKLSFIGVRGAPDRLFLRNNIAVFVEFKVPGNRPRGQQAVELGRLRKNYDKVYVIDSVKDFRDVFEPLTLGI